MFPTPRIPTAKIPECKPHLQAGEHLKLYRLSPSDYKEIVAVFKGRAAGRGHPGNGRLVGKVGDKLT